MTDLKMKKSGEKSRIPSSIRVFENFSRQYDMWFTRNKWVYKSEIEAVKKHIPHDGLGLEVGVGTGRFSTPFGIELGVDPSEKMGRIAKERGINVICGVGENLPFKDEIFDFVLNVTTICFVKDPYMTLKDTRRVLKDNGSVIIGFVDKKSKLGKIYERRKEDSRFYRPARFYSVGEVLKLLSKLSFTDIFISQTIFHYLHEINSVEPIKEGFGEGGFIVVKAKKR